MPDSPAKVGASRPRCGRRVPEDAQVKPADSRSVALAGHIVGTRDRGSSAVVRLASTAVFGRGRGAEGSGVCRPRTARSTWTGGWVRSVVDTPERDDVVGH